MYIEVRYFKTWNKNRNLKSFVKRRSNIKLWAQASKGHIISWHINILKISYKVCDNENNRYMKYFFFLYFNISFKEYNIYGLKRMRIILKISAMLGSIDQIKTPFSMNIKCEGARWHLVEIMTRFELAFKLAPLRFIRRRSCVMQMFLTSPLNGLHGYGRLRVWIYNSTSFLVFPLKTPPLAIVWVNPNSFSVTSWTWNIIKAVNK